LASGVKCFSAINATVWWPLQPHAFAAGALPSPAAAIKTIAYKAMRFMESSTHNLGLGS
jgi:hypothetical protein